MRSLVDDSRTSTLRKKAECTEWRSRPTSTTSRSPGAMLGRRGTTGSLARATTATLQASSRRETCSSNRRAARLRDGRVVRPRSADRCRQHRLRESRGDSELILALRSSRTSPRGRVSRPESSCDLGPSQNVPAGTHIQSGRPGRVAANAERSSAEIVTNDLIGAPVGAGLFIATPWLPFVVCLARSQHPRVRSWICTRHWLKSQMGSASFVAIRG